MFELAAALDQRRADGAWRERHALAAMHGPAVERDGRRLVNFCGNDYLGLAADRAVVAALIAAARRYGVGSGAAQLVTGYSDEHAVLERERSRLRLDEFKPRVLTSFVRNRLINDVYLLAGLLQEMGQQCAG